MATRSGAFQGVLLLAVFALRVIRAMRIRGRVGVAA